MRSNPYTFKSSFIPDSRVNARPKYDTSLDKLTPRYASSSGTKVRTDTDAYFFNPNFPKPRLPWGHKIRNIIMARHYYLRPRSVEQPILSGSVPHSAHSLGTISTTTGVTRT